MIYTSQESMAMQRLQSHNGTVESGGGDRSDSIMEPLAKMRKLGISDFNESDDTLSSSCSSLFSQQQQPQHQQEHQESLPPSCDEKAPSSRLPSSRISCCGAANKRKRPERSVRFSRTSHVVILPSREDGEAGEFWHSKEELAEFKRAMRNGAASLRHTRTARSMKHVAYLAATAATSGTSTSHDNDANSNNGGRRQQQQPLLPAALPEAIRGMEHLLCPTVCRLLMQRRRMVVDRVLDEQHRLITEEEAAVDGHQDRSAGDAATAVKIARVSIKNSSFSREWCRRITMLHDRTEQR